MIGIPASKTHLLFKPFSQVDNSLSKKYSGTGLGLALCKQIVALLGGQIWLSQSLQGCEFYFTIVAGVQPPSDLFSVENSKKVWVAGVGVPVTLRELCRPWLPLYTLFLDLDKPHFEDICTMAHPDLLHPSPHRHDTTDHVSVEQLQQHHVIWMTTSEHLIASPELLQWLFVEKKSTRNEPWIVMGNAQLLLPRHCVCVSLPLKHSAFVSALNQAFALLLNPHLEADGSPVDYSEGSPNPNPHTALEAPSIPLQMPPLACFRGGLGTSITTSHQTSTSSTTSTTTITTSRDPSTKDSTTTTTTTTKTTSYERPRSLSTASEAEKKHNVEASPSMEKHISSLKLCNEEQQLNSPNPNPTSSHSFSHIETISSPSLKLESESRLLETLPSEEKKSLSPFPSQSEDRSRLRKVNVLIVEDNVVNQKVLCKSLEVS
jgi:hypothetical protein